jgi:hypothetical protein
MAAMRIKLKTNSRVLVRKSNEFTKVFLALMHRLATVIGRVHSISPIDNVIGQFFQHKPTLAHIFKCCDGVVAQRLRFFLGAL